MASGRMRKAVDRSIRQANVRGALDLDAHAAPIAMLRLMADFLDESRGSDTPAMRYATPASFLSYCDALGLLPGSAEAAKAEGPKGRDIGKMRDKFKAFQGGKSA